MVPLVLVWMNLVYAIVAAPAGILSDKIGRKNLLLCGLAALTIADLLLALLPGLGGTAAGIGLWGLYLGLSQGLLSALVADTAPDNLRGTAFGLFNLVNGGALLAASTLAGWTWRAFGPAAAFALGAGFSLLAMLTTAIGLQRAATEQSGK
jgi:MFS family permease